MRSEIRSTRPILIAAVGLAAVGLGGLLVYALLVAHAPLPPAASIPENFPVPTGAILETSLRQGDRISVQIWRASQVLAQVDSFYAAAPESWRRTEYQPGPIGSSFALTNSRQPEDPLRVVIAAVPSATLITVLVPPPPPPGPSVTGASTSLPTLPPRVPSTDVPSQIPGELIPSGAVVVDGSAGIAGRYGAVKLQLSGDLAAAMSFYRDAIRRFGNAEPTVTAQGSDRAVLSWRADTSSGVVLLTGTQAPTADLLVRR